MFHMNKMKTENQSNKGFNIDSIHIVWRKKTIYLILNNKYNNYNNNSNTERGYYFTKLYMIVIFFKLWFDACSDPILFIILIIIIANFIIFVLVNFI